MFEKLFSQQVASILRQAGQQSIRIVVARPVDPASAAIPVRFGVFISALSSSVVSQLYLLMLQLNHLGLRPAFPLVSDPPLQLKCALFSKD